jgi:cell division septation protein DedD
VFFPSDILIVIRIRNPIVAALLCVLSVLTLPADPLVQRSRQLEKAGDPAGGAKLLLAWLDMNAGASGSPQVFLSYMRMEQDLPVLMDASGRFLLAAKGVPGAAGSFEKIARLFDLAGRTEEARNAYLSAHDEGGSDATLISAFLLSLQMNDSDAMAATLQRMPGKGGSAELLLRALTELRTGDRGAARATLVGLADQTGNSDLAVKALWILYQTARTGGDSAGEASARARLGSRFSASPETALASVPASAESHAPHPIVVQLPLPGLIDQGAILPKVEGAPAVPATPTAPATPATPADGSAPGPDAQNSAPKDQQAVPSVPAPSPSVSVQAGSFLMKENADDLLSELARRGFPAVVLHDAIQGRDRYRVFAAAGIDGDAAKTILKKLTDAGFRGFLVQDK